MTICKKNKEKKKKTRDGQIGVFRQQNAAQPSGNTSAEGPTQHRVYCFFKLRVCEMPQLMIARNKVLILGNHRLNSALEDGQYTGEYPHARINLESVTLRSQRQRRFEYFRQLTRTVNESVVRAPQQLGNSSLLFEVVKMMRFPSRRAHPSRCC